MELLEGETLKHRITGKPIPVNRQTALNVSWPPRPHLPAISHARVVVERFDRVRPERDVRSAAQAHDETPNPVAP